MSYSVLKRYLDRSYLEANPTWDSEDACWKAAKIIKMLAKHNIKPDSICDIGCGTGDVLLEISHVFKDSELTGYDVSPDLEQFWKQKRNITFSNRNVVEEDNVHYDLILLLDVIEHVANPFQFLEDIRGKSEYYILHIPLDLSSVSVLREKPLLRVREKVGHIHYYTKNLALKMLEDCGYIVDDYFYTDACIELPERSLKTRVASFPRWFLNLFDKDFSTRLLGGQTLIVLAHV